MSNSRNLASFISVVLALGAGLPSAAATLSGVVMANGRAVESAVVSIYVDGPGSRKFVTITNRSGAYRFANVMNSRHIVIVEKDGRRIYQGAINVKTGEAQFDVKL